MELFEAIYTRRSVRSFSQQKINEQDVKKIIDAGRWAPSACNVQGWRFIVIDDPKVKRDLIDLGAASFLEKAPLGIIVLYDNQTDNLEYMDYVQSAAASIENMLLAAHALGIGGCWICHLPRKEEIRSFLSIPSHYDPIAYIALGYPSREPNPKERKAGIQDIMAYNRYSGIKGSHKSGLRLSVKRVMRKVYYLLPFRKYIAKKADERFENKFD